MLVQKAWIDLFICRLEPTTCHVPLSDALNLLDAILVAEDVELIIDAIQHADQLLGLVAASYFVEIVDVDENDC